jgi:ribosome-associated translation inhibitor RaiA
VPDMSERLRIVPEFRADEYDWIRDLLFGRLERRLSRWEPSQVELELSVKDRDTPKQRLTLECWISGVPRMVATSTERELHTAVAEVRDDLWRQVDKFVTKRETARRSGR